MDVLMLLLGAVVGVVVTVLVQPFLLPWTRRATRAGERFSGDEPVDLLVDHDQAVIWSGKPPWVGFAYWFSSGLPEEPAPSVGFDWSTWAYRGDGVDVGLTIVQLTVQARLPTAVVLDSPIVRVTRREPVGHGLVAAFPAGGADLQPRHFDVDLDTFDPPLVTFQREGSQAAENPAFRLAPGEVERFHIWVRARGEELLTWTLDVPVIANGQRRAVSIAGPRGRELQTLGDGAAAKLERHTFDGDRWQVAP